MAATMIYLRNTRFQKFLEKRPGSIRQWHAEFLAQETQGGITAAKQYGDYLRSTSIVLAVGRGAMRLAPAMTHS